VVAEISGMPAEITVVDNASTDESVTVASGYPGVKVIRNEVNVGYAKAVNQVASAADSTYFLLLNPDIEVAPGSIRELTNFMDEHPDAGIGGAKLLNPDGSLQMSCRRFLTLPAILMRRTFLGKIYPNSKVLRDYLMSDWDHSEPRVVDWVLGACMCVRRAAMDEVGLMDERFFLYFEDVDWCYRMKKRGWKTYYVPDSRMTHVLRRESAKGGLNRALAFHILSMLHFFEKWNAIMYRMKKHRERIRVALLVAGNLFAINSAFFIVYQIRAWMGAFLINPMMPVSVYMPFLVFANLVMMFSFQVFGLHRLKPGFNWIDDLLDIGKAAFVGSILLMATTFLAHQLVYSRLLVVLYLPAVIVVAVALRSVIRAVYSSLRRGGFDLRRVLIAGSGTNAVELASTISAHPELGYEFVGFVTADGANPVARRACELSSLAECVNQEMIGEVVIALDDNDIQFTSSVLEKCKTEGVSVSVVTDQPGECWSKVRTGTFLGHPILSYDSEPTLAIRLLLKRLADFLGSIVLLGVGSPVWVCVTLIGVVATGRLPFESTDSVDSQGERVSVFFLAGGEAGGFWGRIVDRFGLFPALINVVAGGMSLVGSDPFDRSSGRAGMTGLWKLGGKGEALGVMYSKEWSLSGDLKILIMTSTRLFSLR
jgi:hypothetical protein